MKAFLLRRLVGLAYIVDGLIVVFTPFNPGFALAAARALAQERFKNFRKG